MLELGFIENIGNGTKDFYELLRKEQKMTQPIKHRYGQGYEGNFARYLIHVTYSLAQNNIGI